VTKVVPEPLDGIILPAVRDILAGNVDDSGIHCESSELKSGELSRTRLIEKYSINFESLDFVKKVWEGRDKREFLINKAFSSYTEDLDGRWRFARFPAVYFAHENEKEGSSIVRFVDGHPLKLKFESSFDVGYCLGEMSRELSYLFPCEKPFERGRVRNLNVSVEEKRLDFIGGSQRKTVLSVLEKFNSRKSEIDAWMRSAKRAFCHNDVKPANLLAVGSDQGVERYYFLDWASGGWDSLGSDIGGVFFQNAFERFEEAGQASEVQDRIVDGFLEGYGVALSPAEREELLIAANLHFFVRFFPWAVKSTRKDLLSRVLKRANHLIDVFG